MKLDPNTFSTSLPHGWGPADRLTIHRQLIFHKMSLSRLGAQWKQSSRFQANLLLSVRVTVRVFAWGLFFNIFNWVDKEKESRRRLLVTKITHGKQFIQFIITKLSIILSLDYLLSWLRDCCYLKLTVPLNSSHEYWRRKIHDGFN